MLNKEKLLSGVYGLAVGDALGVPVEFCSRETLDRAPVESMEAGGVHKQKRGTWSDDTSMVLATLDAMSAGGLSFGMVMDNFQRWLIEAKYTATGVVFDVGGTTSAAIHNYIFGKPLESCGLADERSNGNGSLMRMLPMVYYVRLKYGLEVSPVAVDQIYRLSGLTHAHIISKVCCVYYVYIGMYIMEYGKEKGLHAAIRGAIEAVEKYYFVEQEEIPCVLQLTGMNSLVDCVNLNREDIESTGYVLYSLIAAVWCLWNSSSYEEAVLVAVNLGSDTDTIAAITGSLAGLYYGLEGIPVEWLKELRNRKEIEAICDTFYNTYK